jgi:hypothetical protein
MIGYFKIIWWIIQRTALIYSVEGTWFDLSHQICL